MSISALALSRPVTVLMAYTCAAVLGLVAARLLPLEFFPDIEFPGILVQAPYPNSTPEEVARYVTRPLEESLATLGGIHTMRSESRDDGAWVFLQFAWGSNLAVKGVEARERVDAVRGDLPDDLERVTIRRFASDDQPVLMLRISSDRDLSNAYEMLERNLKRPIERLAGVSQVDLYGVEPREIRIRLNADRIAAHGIDLNALYTTLRRSNFSLAGGEVTERARVLTLHPIGEYRSLEAIGATVLTDFGLRLRDIAEVEQVTPERTQGRHLDRRYAIGLDVKKEAGANLVDVVAGALEAIDAARENPEMRGIRLYTMDNQAAGVRDSLRDLLRSGMIGALLSFVVLYGFLRHWVLTLIVAMAVPFSLLITLGGLYVFGYSLNILTMMGLMLSIGMLVDNAVVVSENVFRHRQLLGHGDERAVRAATLRGIDEVALAVTAGTLTTAIVFLPNILGQQNNITIFLSHVAVTICIALVASLLVARTLIPLLTTRVRVVASNTMGHARGGHGRGARAYAAILGWTLRHRGLTVLGIILIVGSVALPAQLVEAEMFPESQERRLFLRYNVNGQYPLAKVEDAVAAVEAYLYANEARFQLRNVYSYFSTTRAESTLLLTDDGPRNRAASEIADEILAGLPQLAIAAPSFQQQRSGATEGLAVLVYGEDAERLREYANQVAWILRGQAEVSDVRVDLGPRDQEVRVVVDRERARRNGLNSQDVAEAINLAMRGQRLQPYRTRTGELAVYLEFRKADRADLDQLLRLPIVRPDGERISLSSVARLEIGDVPGTIVREDRATSVRVEFAAGALTPAAAKDEVARVLAGVELPQGYHWGFSRGFEEEAETMMIMLVNMALAIALIYLVMAALFESIVFPLSIITSIAFSFIGVIWFFALTGTTFTFMALIGMLVLMGVVVNNGIVLVDRINQLRWAGASRAEAILQAGQDRLRPILMTVATTILGLVPLALGEAQVGGNGPPYDPMARAVIGGLAFSTVVSLIVLPTIYALLDDVSNWGRRVGHQALAGG